jgi:hypothetical protein
VLGAWVIYTVVEKGLEFRPAGLWKVSPPVGLDPLIFRMARDTTGARSDTSQTVGTHVCGPFPVPPCARPGSALSANSLQHKVGRVFRSFAISYGEPKRMQVQAPKQLFTLAEEYRHRCEVQGVDESSLQILTHC